jgi:hypothetical protein
MVICEGTLEENASSVVVLTQKAIQEFLVGTKFQFRRHNITFCESNKDPSEK